MGSIRQSYAAGSAADEREFLIIFNIMITFAPCLCQLVMCLPRYFLHNDAVIQITGASASILRLRCDAQESKVTHFAPECTKVSAGEEECEFSLSTLTSQTVYLLEVIRLINLLSIRRQFFLKEVKGNFSQLLLLLIQAVNGIVDGVMCQSATPCCSRCQTKASLLQQSVAVFGKKAQRHCVWTEAQVLSNC